jgi:hypothetical protein
MGSFGGEKNSLRRKHEDKIH